MNANQFFVMMFALFVIIVDIWAVIAIVRAPSLRLKPLWIIGSLFGFIGPGLNWSQPSDLIVLMGISAPVVMVTIIAGQVVVKTAFPIIAIIVLAKIYSDRLPQA